MPRVLSGQQVERTDVAKMPFGAAAHTGAAFNLVSANANRVAIWISNQSGANVMYIGLGTGVTANNGIVLRPNETREIRGYTGVISIIGTAADIVSYAEL